MIIFDHTHTILIDTDDMPHCQACNRLAKRYKRIIISYNPQKSLFDSGTERYKCLLCLTCFGLVRMANEKLKSETPNYESFSDIWTSCSGSEYIHNYLIHLLERRVKMPLITTISYKVGIKSYDISKKFVCNVCKNIKLKRKKLSITKIKTEKLDNIGVDKFLQMNEYEMCDVCFSLLEYALPELKDDTYIQYRNCKGDLFESIRKFGCTPYISHKFKT